MFYLMFLLVKFFIFLFATEVKENALLVYVVSILISYCMFAAIERSKSSKKASIAFIVYALISVTLFIDTLYYRYFLSLTSISLLSQLSHVRNVTDVIALLVDGVKILLIADLPFFIFRFIKTRTFHTMTLTIKPVIRTLISRTVAMTLVIVMLYVALMGNVNSVLAYEFYTYHFSDIIKTVSSTLIEEEPLTQADFEQLQANTQLESGDLTGIASGKNLILIQVEALQTIMLNQTYLGIEITPNLNRLIAESGTLYFDDTFQMVSRGNTSDAEFVTLNSMFPSLTSATYEDYTENTLYSLPELLSDYGYTSWSFHGNERSFWNREVAHSHQGFDRFVSMEDFAVNEVDGFGMIDEEFLEQSARYINELDQQDDNPFFAFLITVTSHTPFEIDEKYRLLDIDEENLITHYIQSIYYADYALGQFIEQLKLDGHYDDSVLAIYGDHFGITALSDEENELMVETLELDSYNVDDMMRIPLIIHVPDAEINQTISTVGSQLEFMPTLLNLFGYENQEGLMFGTDLVNTQSNAVITTNFLQLGSFITDEIIYMQSRDQLYENGTIIVRETREVLDLSAYEQQYTANLSILRKSQYYLTHDLLAYYQSTRFAPR